MKKNTKIIFAVIFIAALLGVSAPIVINLTSNNTESPQSSYVRIYVNSTIYGSLSSELTQYRQDVINQGYTADLVNWSINSATILKQNISYYYNSQGLVGVVLIGTMPYALAQYIDRLWAVPRYFPIDLYLTDLDGNWTDINGDLTYNFDDDKYATNVWERIEHNDGSGDIFPEIWLGRINPEPLNNTDHLQSYQDYFQRNHEYRTGQLTRPHSALYYIDDTWSSLISEYLSNFTAYTNITAISNNYQTNRADYLSRITQIYEFVHLMTHSWPYEHQFDVPSSPTEYVYPSDILNANTKALFYNLYCCYASNYAITNNLGTQYLFSNSTLTVVGTTRSGGTACYQPFYDSLNQGECFGESIRVWFHNPENQPSPQGYDNWETCLGVTILGDPLLTI